jgi:four helix bundle protein
MQDYKKLKVWEKAHALVLSIYQLTKMMPKEETYGLIATMRRTAVNIPTRIADGCGRYDNTDFTKQLWMAGAATKELDYLLLLAHGLGYITDEMLTLHTGMIDEIGKMLTGLLKRTTN